MIGTGYEERMEMSDDWEKELKRLEERMAERRGRIREQDREIQEAIREAEERRDADKPGAGGDSDKPGEQQTGPTPLADCYRYAGEGVRD